MTDNRCMDTAIEILGITGPIYLAIALGYFVTQRGLFSRADMQVYGKFTIQLALPALLFNALSRRSVAEILNWQYLAAYALGTLLVVAGGLFWARRVQGKPLALSSVLTMGMACSNSGFVGYPVMMLTLGGTVAGVSLALNMVVENLLIIPLLLAVAGSEGAPGQWRQAFVQTLKGLLGNPMIWGIASGFLVSLLGLHVLSLHLGPLNMPQVMRLVDGQWLEDRQGDPPLLPGQAMPEKAEAMQLPDMRVEGSEPGWYLLDFKLAEAAVASSTMAAFCWVTWSILLTAELTSLRPVACSWAEAAISVTSASISATWLTMASRAWPVRLTSCTPEPTWVVEAVIRPLISLAASAERWARARTSEATTAKPLPASPARAASTPAFRARRLVWKAISSITPMIWVIWPELCSISDMAATASLTTRPDWAASARAPVCTRARWSRGWSGPIRICCNRTTTCRAKKRSIWNCRCCCMATPP